MKLNFRILLTGSAIGLGTYVVASLAVTPQNFVPAEFSEARIRGAAYAEQIVAHAETSVKNLEVIAYFDREGNAPAALDLITKELGKINEVHAAAIGLSGELEKMARYLSDIKPARARLHATEAVSAEVALVSHLLLYNDHLKELFGALHVKFQNQGAYSNGKVNDLIEKVNEETRAINELNRRFNASLAEFDRIFN